MLFWEQAFLEQAKSYGMWRGEPSRLHQQMVKLWLEHANIQIMLIQPDDAETPIPHSAFLTPGQLVSGTCLVAAGVDTEITLQKTGRRRRD